MKLHEIAKLPGLFKFREWNSEKILLFDPDTTLVDSTGKLVPLTKSLLERDFEVVCEHPEEEWAEPHVGEDRKLYFICCKCKQTVKVTAVKTVPPPLVPEGIAKVENVFR